MHWFLFFIFFILHRSYTSPKFNIYQFERAVLSIVELEENNWCLHLYQKVFYMLFPTIITPKRLNNGFVTLFLHLMCSCFCWRHVELYMCCYVLYLKCFSRESDEKICFVCFKSYFNSESVCTRNFVCKVMCMVRISFKVTLKMGWTYGMHVSLKFFFLFFFFTYCNAAWSRKILLCFFW